MYFSNIRKHTLAKLAAIASFRSKRTEILEETFLQAAEQNDVDRIVKYIAKGGNPNCSRVGDGYTALHMAAEQGHLPLLLKLLIYPDIEIDPKTHHDHTPLFLACLLKRLKIMKCLLKNGADPNTLDRFDKTPIFFAVLFGNIAMTQLLLKYGAEVNVADYIGNTPLHIAAFENHFLPMVNLLFIHGADPNMDTGNMPLFLECVLYCHTKEQLEVTLSILKHGTDINVTDKVAKRNALHFVAITGYIPLAKELLRLNWNVQQADFSGKKPLDIAIAHNNKEVIRLLKSYSSPSEMSSIH